MDNLLNVSPGTIIWTIINFLLLLLLLSRVAVKPIANALKAREDRIRNQIADAEKAGEKAQALLKESENKLDSAQKEMSEIINKGKAQAEDIIRKATESAEEVKKQKIEEAVREIERSKETAIKELRGEVADLVIQATEKILEEKLDRAKHLKIVESYIEKIPKN